MAGKLLARLPATVPDVALSRLVHEDTPLIWAHLDRENWPGCEPN